jgi:hypothetical protein
VIDKIIKVDCLAKIWRKLGDLTRDALSLSTYDAVVNIAKEKPKKWSGPHV